MKVVQILPDLENGGVERGTLEVAKALVDAGHESIVISAGGAMVAELETQGSQHISWDLGKKSLLSLRHIYSLRGWLKQEKPDVVHLRSRFPAWIFWLAWRGLNPQYRPRFITTVHGLYSISKYSAIMCRGEKVIAVSEQVKNYIQKNYPETPEANIRVIHRGISPEEFPVNYQPSSSWLKQWQLDFKELKDKQVLTLAGRLTRLKGHHDFIDLIKSLVQQEQNVHGLIVGGEDTKRKAYAQELYQRVKDEGLEQHISFTGARSDIREIYSQSNLVFSLSIKPESFGRTVAEALTLGIPVVGYNHGGVSEILHELYPQGLTPLNAPKQLSNKVLELLKNPSQPKINNCFLKQNMLEQTLNLYQSLCR